MPAETMAERLVEEIPGGDVLQKRGHKAAHAIHDAVLAGGRPARAVGDALHGTWLGHPLHPALTDIVIGAWMIGGVFDVVAAVTGSERAAWAGDRLAEIGTAAAVPTALAGLADYSTVPKPATRDATIHGLTNAAGFALYVGSIVERRRGNRGRGRALSWTAQALTMFSAWLGGVLVYKHKVGVDRSESFDGPATWTPVLEESELPDRTPKRVEVDGKGVLLYREDGEVHAIGSVCSHAGGALEEGEFGGGCVRCPLHDSVFDLRSGRVVHGPATRPEPCFSARVREGRVEIRLAGRGGAG